MRTPRLRTLALAAALLIGLTACGGTDGTDDNAAGADAKNSGQFPVTVKHALGTTVVPSKPKRVATVNWANEEVPLALGVVPVGMAKANFGDDDGDGVLPWTEKRLKELDAKTPVLFDETDGIDFEAVADTKPDVILAAYSGLTEQDYETLSQIAPVVAYPEAAWATPGATSSARTAKPSDSPTRVTSSSATSRDRSARPPPSTPSSRGRRRCS